MSQPNVTSRNVGNNNIPTIHPRPVQVPTDDSLNRKMQNCNLDNGNPNQSLTNTVTQLKQGYVPGVTITDHSWYKKMAHIVLENGLVVRCELGEIILKPEGFFGIRVRYREGRKMVKTNKSPIFIAHAHFAYWSGAYVSESEQGYEFEKRNIVEKLPNLRLTGEVTDKLSTSFKQAFTWVVMQVDDIIKKI
jgi:hypothetical protein